MSKRTGLKIPKHNHAPLNELLLFAQPLQICQSTLDPLPLVTHFFVPLLIRSTSYFFFPLSVMIISSRFFLSSPGTTSALSPQLGSSTSFPNSPCGPCILHYLCPNFPYQVAVRLPSIRTSPYSLLTKPW